jgi:hypothetical protein
MNMLTTVLTLKDHTAFLYANSTTLNLVGNISVHDDV